MVDGERLAFRQEATAFGFVVRHRGARITTAVLTPRQYELKQYMVEKRPPDTSGMLLCPMPGLVVALHVAEGDEVSEGQALCTVEAMKMENILRAERSGRIVRINAKIGDSLAVDESIMEFGAF